MNKLFTKEELGITMDNKYRENTLNLISNKINSQNYEIMLFTNKIRKNLNSVLSRKDTEDTLVKMLTIFP